jgi:hypothetical protein
MTYDEYEAYLNSRCVVWEGVPWYNEDILECWGPI